MSAKWSITEIARAHFATYVHARTGKRLAADYLAFVGTPAAVAIFASAMATTGRFQLVDVSRLLGGIGVFTGLLFGLLTNVFSLSLRVRRDEGLDSQHPVVRQVRELFANLGWSVIIGCILVSLIVVAGATHPAKSPLSPPWTGVLVFLFLHLMLTVLMALKRLWYAHEKISDLPSNAER